MQLIVCRTDGLGPTKFTDDSIASLPTCEDPETGLVLHYINYVCVVDLFANGKCDLFQSVSKLMCANTAGSVHIQ